MCVEDSIVVLPSLMREDRTEKVLSVPTVSTELIAVDTNYNLNTKKLFRKYIDNFQRIVYLPPRLKDEKLKLRYSSLWNTAFLYAEGDWIICVKPGVEISRDFLAHLHFSSFNELANRAKSREFAVICNKTTQFLNEDNRFLRLEDSAHLPFEIVVFPRKFLNIINGYDELYDYMGSKIEEADRDFLYRLRKSGCLVYFDRELADYYDTYPSFRFQFSEPLVNIFYFQRHQIMQGKIKAFNGFDYKTENLKCLANRTTFELV